MKGVVEGVETNTNPSDFKAEVERLAKEQGISMVNCFLIQCCSFYEMIGTFSKKILISNFR